MFTYTPAEHAEVGKMMKAIVDALKPFRARKVPAILAAMALMRCQMSLIKRMPRSIADPFAEACVATLKGESLDQLVVPFNQRFLQ